MCSLNSKDLLFDVQANFEEEISCEDISDLYHYTSPDAFLNILKDDEIQLRFTRSDCVNDISEGNDIKRMYKRVCEKLVESNEISQEFYTRVVDLEIDNGKFFTSTEMDSDTDIPIRIYTQYITFLCCFSLDHDSLPMWNYYLYNNKYQGYCLGFDRSIIGKYLDKREYFNFDIKQVIYSDNKKSEIITKLVKDSYNYVCNSGDIISVISLIPYYLEKAQFVFKSECFQHEREVRLIYNRPLHNDNAEFPIEFTAKNGYIIPYVTIPFEKIYLKEIVTAPLAQKEFSISTVNALLEKRKYHKVRVISSEVPIRF